MITASKRRIVSVYIATILLGYAVFIAPNLLFGIFKIGGGLSGWNFAWIGLFQVICIALLLWAALKSLGGNFGSIGWDFSRWRRDAALGALLGLAWAAIEMFFIIPAHGGASEPNVARIIEGIDGKLAGLAGYLVLGIIGGGIAEELFNRGFAINGLVPAFANRRVGLWVAAGLSVVLFMIGHLPTTSLDWVTILIPTLLYTALFVGTRRLTAPIAAHALHNGMVLLIIWFSYIA